MSTLTTVTVTTQGRHKDSLEQPGIAWDSLSSFQGLASSLSSAGMSHRSMRLFSLKPRNQSVSIALMNSCWTHTKIVLQSSLPCVLHDSTSIVVVLPSQLNFLVTSLLVSSWKELEQLAAYIFEKICTTFSTLASKAFNLLIQFESTFHAVDLARLLDSSRSLSSKEPNGSDNRDKWTLLIQVLRRKSNRSNMDTIIPLDTTKGWIFWRLFVVSSILMLVLCNYIWYMYI